MVGEIIFPNTVPPFFKTSVLICGNPSVEDYKLRLEGIRAHNRWLADWCAEFPDRRAGIGLVYLNDIDAALEDVQWIAKHGLRGGVLLPHVPPDCTHIRPLYDPEAQLRLPVDISVARMWNAIAHCVQALWTPSLTVTVAV